MDRDDDGPPAWWTARQSRAAARRPLCDEYGTPAEDDDCDDDDGWEPHYPAETPVQRMGRLLGELGDRMHGGWPVAFRHVGGAA